MVLDNYGTHKTPRVIGWFARHPRYHLHFTPTSGSWINQVERWFGKLTEKRIRRGSFLSVASLEKAIQEYLDHYNGKSEAICVDGGRRPDPGQNSATL